MNFPGTLDSPADQESSQPAGIYVHIPFCATKCNYCDFSTALFDRDLADRYLGGLIEEIRHSDVPAPFHAVDSVYIGGGTPSMISAGRIAELLEELARRFDIVSGAEISLEMNPSLEEAGRIDSYRAAGVNRLSIGIQSFNDSELRGMTRAHNAEEAMTAVHVARDQGIPNVSIDLMLGLPGQTGQSFRHSIEVAAALPVHHLSLYMLELHSGTPLHGSVRSGETDLPSDSFVSEEYLRLVAFLNSKGLRQYEISNFARDRHQSRHNWKYWTRAPYLGFGVSSHSFDGMSRWNNAKSLTRYLEKVESGESPRESHTEVSAAESLRESIFLGLRTCRGVNAQLLDDVVRRQSRLRQRWPLFLEQDWVKRKGDRYCLTPAGYLVSNEILSEFM